MEDVKKNLSFAVAAILVEGIITYMNQFLVKGEFSLSMLTSIVLGIVVAVCYRLDLFSYFGMKSCLPWVGNILTGVLIARGSNYLFDLLSQLMSR